MIVEETLDGLEGINDYIRMFEEMMNVVDNVVLEYSPDYLIQIERENANNLDKYKKAHNSIIIEKKRHIISQLDEEKGLSVSLGPFKNKLDQFLNTMPYYQTEQLLVQLIKNDQVQKIQVGLNNILKQKQEIQRLKYIHKEMMEDLRHIKTLLDFYAMIFQIKVYETEDEDYLILFFKQVGEQLQTYPLVLRRGRSIEIKMQQFWEVFNSL